MADQFEMTTLPNITRAEFVALIELACRELGAASHAELSVTCRSLLVQWACLELAADHVDYVRPAVVNGAREGARLAAIYLSNGCNVRFKGDPK